MYTAPPERLSVLSVAFPLAPVSSSTAGGAEQVLAMIDRALVSAGHESLVIACQGSRCAGELIATPRSQGTIDQAARERAHAHTRQAIEAVLATRRVDVVHMHGLDFHGYLPAPGPVVLATLHLPPAWYPPGVFAITRPRTYLSCVSASQARQCPPAGNLAGVVENGVELDVLGPEKEPEKQPYVLALGRICPEKGFHRALRAARRAGAPMVLAGEVFPYVEHQRYFAAQVMPLLDAERRYIGPVDMAQKRGLMARARCVVVPSEVCETSSLVAMEALACGAPVITSGAGALAEIVEHGRTGFVVADEDGMAAAIRDSPAIDPAACRQAAETRFCGRRMAWRYMALYRRLLVRERVPLIP
jgi:glycosyltransferase involved in cell wall biosynthesis